VPLQAHIPTMHTRPVLIAFAQRAYSPFLAPHCPLGPGSQAPTGIRRGFKHKMGTLGAHLGFAYA